MEMPFLDKKLWRSFLNRCHRANSRFRRLIVSQFMVSESEPLKTYFWYTLNPVPGVCEHTVMYIVNEIVHKPCLSLTEQATQGQTTLLVVTGGTVKFEGNKLRFFNQNFLLTAQATPNSDQPVWKIASDCFRFQDWNSWASVYGLPCNICFVIK